MASGLQGNTPHVVPNAPSYNNAVNTSVGGAGTTAAARPSDNASSIDHVYEKAPVVLTKKQKLRRHCGRFKWWYLAAAIILLIILLPLLFLVILPAIVRRIVSDQTLPVYSGTFVAMTPATLMVSLETSLDTPIPAVIDETTLFLYNSETQEGSDFTPFLNITIPSTHIGRDTSIFISNQTATVTNETELEYWFNHVFDDPRVDLSVRGDTTIHLSSLHYGAHIDKTVEFSSLNYLAGLSITDMYLNFPALDNGTNMHGMLNIPNWGVLALHLGDVSFNLVAGDLNIGLITIYDLVMEPGNNSLPFYGELFLSEIVQNLGRFLDAEAESLNNGQIQIDAVGNQTVIDGLHIPYVERILNAKRLHLYISVIEFASAFINGVSGGGNASIVSVLGDVVGNNTIIEQALAHWNKTSNAAKSSEGRARSLNPKRNLALLRLGMEIMARGQNLNGF
ncbi:hypothetical protein PFICI_12720 [Pestalotiopsis fici W106-1]|uniref:Uncharacterized protein n=1 Tax=Pestalotiopsis fici (strain W106-1 / CGMCC3.15140) TaxID=1229662 RepID=W3WSH3_PESFW|nr:uncharacterized protein PFICI_12720 [Pestalotiopsis fici W106-1]ETS75776.1 hypothetical protein PFICI_12720 [Pestalotiopsis fici W106-1]